ncbi:MAG: tRNA pseudouridine(38-40) synthase TruA [Ruminococcus sp.]|uniref:tRNA pseudouridine(38-40) synthase TruA n=1 Tax=Ruminococcus sp. TaxID=41978 RepID=UPI002873C8F3|nr:tRNA pseudouridine(38-40) synthase TruA [Ruminococcus sp.]MBQ3284125.1 tRNA pseudouridine(38-40) synthase TruA [Ruminococcus sp.]
MRNLLLTLSYCGRNLHGWQIQDNALTVQEVFQDALYQIIQERPDIKGCSRTDSGVHANMYCVSMMIAHPITEDHLMMAMNRYLPDDVAVTGVREVGEDFHARYSCKGKEYVYKVWNSRVRNPFLHGLALHYRYDMDVDQLHREAQAFIGTHDFTSFCTLDKREKGDFTRTVKYFNVQRSGDLVTFTVAADGFLYNMVRIMVGTLLAMNNGRIPFGTLSDIIEAENRKCAGPTAPACGLYLNKVFYHDYE